MASEVVTAITIGRKARANTKIPTITTSPNRLSPSSAS
jgi:hypothetical protein